MNLILDLWATFYWRYGRRFVNFFWKTKEKQDQVFSSIARSIEIMKIKNGDLSGKVFVLWQDWELSPPTIGDFLYLVFIARLLKKNGADVTISFNSLSDGIREDWSDLDQESQREIIQTQKHLAAAFLDCSLDQIREEPLTNRVRLKLLFQRKSNVTHVLLGALCAKSAGYKIYFSLFRQLVRSFGSEKDLIVNEDCFRPYLDQEVGRKYVTWHCRHNLNWNEYRNTSRTEFLFVYRILKDKFPDHSIMLVSDSLGCEHFRELSYEHELGLLFSKDYSNNFLGDCALILCSDFFFAYKGGGISAITFLSAVPYLVAGKKDLDEKREGNSNGALFQEKFQKWIDIKADETDLVIIAEEIKTLSSKAVM